MIRARDIEAEVARRRWEDAPLIETVFSHVSALAGKWLANPPEPVEDYSLWAEYLEAALQAMELTPVFVKESNR